MTNTDTETPSAVSFRDASNLVSAQEAAERTALAGSGIELCLASPEVATNGLVDLELFMGEPVTLELGVAA